MNFTGKKPNEIKSLKHCEHETVKQSIITTPTRSREPSQETDLPGYMRPLDRSLRANSPHLESINKFSNSQGEVDERVKKFGVTLRKIPKQEIVQHREESQDEIEDIYDAVLLEEMVNIKFY